MKFLVSKTSATISCYNSNRNVHMTSSDTDIASELNEKNKHRVRAGKSSAGLGLFAKDTFKKGERIVEYVGKRLTNKEVEAIRSNKYLLEINSKVTIDGSPRINIARYANHSCKPNAEADIIRRRMFLLAKKTILPGDEITWDYGKEYFNEYIKKGNCRCAPCDSGSSTSKTARA